MPAGEREALKELDGDYAWITALRAPAIRKLMADDGPPQLSLFDEQDLAEITPPDFPCERLIACRNPALADERARKREDLLAATEKALAPLTARVAAGRLAGAAEIGKKAGEIISKYPVAPAEHSASAQAKARRQHDGHGRPTSAARDCSPTSAP